MSTTVWSANTSLSVNTIVAPTESKRVAGLFFKVTVAGTTGASEPNWPNTIKETVNGVTSYITVYDTNTTANSNVQYVPLSAVFSDLQPINPSAIIELFILKLVTVLHGSNDGLPPENNETNIYRFHNGSNLNANTDIIWANKRYFRIPIEATGFAYQRGQLPRPKIVVSNAQGNMSTILDAVNKITTGNDLTGATVTRVRTMAKFLDAVNFPNRDENNNPVNPLGTPDPTAEFKRQIFVVDRKSVENREIVEFELAASTDMAGVRAPKRQCTRALFPSIGTFNQ